MSHARAEAAEGAIGPERSPGALLHVSRRVLASLAVSVFLAGRAAASPCSGSLSGSVKGEFTCIVDVTTSDDGKVVFVISPKDPIADVPSYAPGAFEIPEPPRARTYTLDSLGLGRASVAAAGGTLYTATKTSSQRGEVTLVLARVRKHPKTKGAFEVRGSYRARLIPAGAGKQGEVIVEVKF